MARFSDDFLSELHARCDIEQVLSSYVQLKRRGKNLVGLCPFHNEKTPSFTVYPESQSFFCFGCGVGGEVINFIRRAENLDYVEAVRFLCDKAGMAMPQEGYDNSMAERRKRIYEINREAARFFNSCLFSPQGEKALEYFKSRGYSKKTLIRFGMGYAPDDWRQLLNYMRGKGYSYEELYTANLANKSEKNGKVNYYDSFRNRVMVPIIDARGNVVAFGGRVLDDSKPKYINTSDTPVYKKSLGVFGLNFAKNTKEESLILVEGYMDAISLHQAGFDNAIACLGTALTNEMAHLLSRYCKEIILCYDADEAGQKATQRAMGIFSSIGMKMKIIRLSGGKDPDEILKKFGPERFRDLIEGAANDIEYDLLRERKNFDLETSDGKLKYLTSAAEILANCENSIAQDIYASRLSEELGVEKQTILSRIEVLKKRNSYTKRQTKIRTIQQDAISTQSKEAAISGSSLKAVRAQQRIIASLMKNPDYLRKTKDKISAADFTAGNCARIFEALKIRIEEGGNLEFSSMADILTPDEMSTLVGLCKKNEELPTTEKEFEDCVSVLEAERKEKERRLIDPANLDGEDFLKLFKNKKN